MSGYAHQWAKRQKIGNPSAKAVLKAYADWAAEDYTTWTSNDELIVDTELDIKTIRKARALLIELGYLVETARRAGETRSITVYQMLAPEGSSVVQIVDRRTHQTISLSPPTREEFEAQQDQKRSRSKNGGVKGDQKRSPSKNGAPPKTPGSPSTFTAKPLHFYPQGGPKVEGNKAELKDVNGLSSSNARSRVREGPLVDNCDAAAADESKPERRKPDRESEIRLLLAELSGGPCEPDNEERVHLLAWVGDEVNDDELREAYRRALQRRKLKSDERPVYIAFLAAFVREVLAERSAQAGGEREWWLGGETQVCNEGNRLGVRPKKPDEPLASYRVLVAKAAGKGPWIDFVLKDAQRSNSEGFMRFVVATLGEALLPVDWYAS